MKVKEILEKYEALGELSEKELDFQTALTIINNMSVLKNPVEVAEKKLNEIAEKNADRNENGEKIFTDPTHFQLKAGNTFFEEKAALHESEVDVELKKIPKTAISGCLVKPRTLQRLMDLLE